MQSKDLSMARYIMVPVHREGLPFIGLFALVALVLAFVWAPLGWLGALATVWCVYFFRNPDRVTPVRSGLVISPADGVVCAVGPHVPPPELAMGDEPRQRIAVFMSVFDVHINRVPLSGKVSRIAYTPGLFVNASLDKAAAENERMAIRLDLDGGGDIGFVQIAGLVARRIKCDLLEGQQVVTGERFGLIRFGSRVDVYLPLGAKPLVALGTRCLSGETVLADLASDEDSRVGEVR